jgi:hypothetical protein
MLLENDLARRVFPASGHSPRSRNPGKNKDLNSRFCRRGKKEA